MMIKKKFLLLLIIALFMSAFIEGCGCGKKAEEGGENAEGGGEGQPAEGGEQQEAARPAAPAQTPQAAAPAAAPAAPKAPAAAPGAPGGQQKPGDTRRKPKPIIPDDKFMQIEFDTKEAGLISTMQTYNAKLRRNVFRSIFSMLKYRKEAENEMDMARKMIDKVKGKSPGTFNESQLKLAESNYGDADKAFKDQNYFKAKASAEKAKDLAIAADSKPGTTAAEGNTIDLYYKGYYELGDERSAMITQRDGGSDSEKVFIMKIGEIITQDLPNYITIDNPDGTQTKVNKREFQIDDISEDCLVVTNITEKKPPIRIPISKQSSKDTSSSDKNKDKDKDKKTESNPAPVQK